MNFEDGRPASHFDTFFIALLTVFQVSMLDYLFAFLVIFHAFLSSADLFQNLLFQKNI